MDIHMNCCFTHQIRENPPLEPKSATGASIDHCSFGHDNIAQHMNDLFFWYFAIYGSLHSVYFKWIL